MVKFFHILNVTQTNTVSNLTFKISEVHEWPEVIVIQLSNRNNEGIMNSIIGMESRSAYFEVTVGHKTSRKINRH
jgi:hypothetical protein